MELFKDNAGICKFVIIILGMINVVLVSYTFPLLHHPYEAFYLSAVCICFIASFIWTLAIITGATSQDSKADLWYHIIGFIMYVIALLLFGKILFNDDHHYGNRDHKWLRIGHYIISIILAVLYAVVAILSK